MKTNLYLVFVLVLVGILAFPPYSQGVAGIIGTPEVREKPVKAAEQKPVDWQKVAEGLNSKDEKTRMQAVKMMRNGDKNLILSMMIHFDLFRDHYAGVRVVLIDIVCERFDKSFVEPFLLDQLENIPDGLYFEEGKLTTGSFYKRVLRGLGEIKSSAAVPKLLRYARKSHHATVRKYAIRALGEIQDKSCVKYLLRSLKYEGYSELGSLIKKTIGKIYDKKPLQAVVQLLDHEKFSIRYHSVNVLKYFPQYKVIPLIEERLKKENVKIILRSLLETMVGYKSWRVMPYLLKYLDDDNNDLRDAALKGLKTLTGEDFGMDAPKWRAWWAKNKMRILEKAGEWDLLKKEKAKKEKGEKSNLNPLNK